MPSQIAWQLLTRNLDKLNLLASDKGYDWELLRHKLRSEGVKTVIKYREFGWHGVTNNVFSIIRRTIYGQILNRRFSRSGENTAKSCERERGSVDFVNWFSNAPSETSN